MEQAATEIPTTHSSPPTMRALSIGIIFQYAVGGTFMPLLVLFYRDRGLTYQEVGFVYIGISVVMAACPILWGALADRNIPVNRLIVALHIIGALCLVFLSFQTSFWGMAIWSALWFAFGMPTNALFNALSYHNLKSPKTEFGFIRMWGSFGWMLPSIGIWAWMQYQQDVKLSSVILSAAFVEALFIPIAWILPHTPPSSRAIFEKVESFKFFQGVQTLLKTPGFFLLLILNFFMFWSFTVAFYYSAVELEAVGIARKWLLPIQCLGPIAEVPLFFFLRGILKKYGVISCLAAGALSMVVRHLIFCGGASPIWLILSFILLGVSVVLYLIPVSLMIDELAPRKIRATAQAMLLIFGPGLGSLIGQLYSGWQADQSGGNLREIFLVGALTAALGMLIVFLTGWIQRRASLKSSVS